MTPAIPTDPAERDALAGEYVLGTLDAAMARAVERALPQDAALRAAVEAWEARLAPLSTLAPPEAPPPGLWERIERALDPTAAVAAATHPPPTQSGPVSAGSGAAGPSAPRRSRRGWRWSCCSARRRPRRSSG
jgi:anti-sigma-K factor RskA